jgi:hypothetical protein
MHAVPAPRIRKKWFLGKHIRAMLGYYIRVTLRTNTLSGQNQTSRKPAHIIGYPPYWYRTRTPAHRHTQTSNPRPTTQPHPPPLKTSVERRGLLSKYGTIFLSKILRSTSCKPSLSIASWLVTIITCKLTTVTCVCVCLCVIQPP